MVVPVQLYPEARLITARTPADWLVANRYFPSGVTAKEVMAERVGGVLQAVVGMACPVEEGIPPVME